MNQVRLLSVLYDMSLAIGGELTVRPLLTRALQRLLVHTSLPTAVALEIVADTPPRVVLARAIGDRRLAALEGHRVEIPLDWVSGAPALLRGADGLPAKSLFQGYGCAVRLPVSGLGSIVLLGPETYTTDLPLTDLFRPVLANLAKALHLCRANEAHTARLEQDRADARSSLLQSREALAAEHAALQESRDMIRESEADLRRAQALSKTGSWALDLGTGELRASAEANRICGMDDRAEVTFSDLVRAVHPDDRATLQAAWATLFEGEPYTREHRIVVGEVTKWVRSRVELERGADGAWARAYGVVQDVSEQKAVARALDRREKIFSAIAEHAGLCVMVVDPRTLGFIEFNDAAHRSLGYTREEFARLTVRDLQVSHTEADIGANVRAILTVGEVELENQHRCKDGSARDVWLKMRHVVVDDGDYIAVLWLDVTARKQAEEEVRKLSLAVEQSPESIAITDLDARIVFVNDAFLRATGYTRGEALGQNPRILQSGKTPRVVFADMWATLARGETWSGELINRRKDGTEFIELAIISPLRQPDGRASHYVAIKKDVTETRQMEAELTRYRHHLEELVQRRTDELTTIFRALPDVYFRLDPRGVILDYLAASTDVLHAPPSAFLNKRMQDVLPAGAAVQVSEALDRLAGGARMVHLEYDLPMPDGDRAYEARLLPLGAGGQAVVVVREITERRSAERALAAARDAAESANRAKSAFLANMSHEIRTPMNAIIGLAHLVRGETTSPRHREQLDKVLGAAHHLLSLINDVLDLSKIEAGKLTIEATEFDVDAVVAGVCDVVSEGARAKGLELVVDVGSLPHALRGDSLRLGQVVVNFCSNAVKFTERGHVRLRGRVIAADDVVTRVRVEVTDTGIGLSEPQRGRLFQSFQQADISTTRRYGGTGLGLVIAKRIAQLMGGEVGFESELGKGSTFWIEAPFGTVRRASSPPRPAPRLEGKRVLVVDDLADAREAMVSVLGSLRARADAVASGAAAIDAVIAADLLEDPYEILLLDWKMPGCDGLETARRLGRARLSRRPHLLLVSVEPGLTSDAWREAGVEGFLAKPFSRSRLLDELASVMDGGQAPPIERAAEGDPGRACRERARARPIRVLLAEDNALNREVAIDLLAGVGLAVDEAHDGEEAVARARAFLYDLVLMDLQMPGLNGFEATRQIRALPDYARVPILAMTASAFDEDRDACIAAGMVAHVAKPVEPKLLYTALLRFWPDDVRPAQREPAAPRAASAPQMANTIFLLMEKISAIPGMNVHRALELLGGDAALFVRLLGRFQEAHRRDGGKVSALLRAGDRAEARRAAHSLRGVAGTLGMTEVQAIATSLDLGFKQGAPDEELLPAMSALCGALEQVGRALDEVLPALELPRPATDVPAIDWPTLARSVARLAALLEMDDTAADGQLQEVHEALARVAGDRITEIAGKIESFDYPGALAVLRAVIAAEPRLVARGGA